jgi:GT2 family glycosyltransferase
VNNIQNFDQSVDIIIPFHGQYDQVTNLIDSIYRYTVKVPYTIYLIDDCSTNENFIQDISASVLNVIRNRRIPHLLQNARNPEQKGFAASARVGFNLGQGSYVCILNSDCLIEDRNWLFNLANNLLRLKPQNVRMIAPITNQPVDGDISQKGSRFNQSENNIILEDHAHLSMYCVLCHRDLFFNCGGFLKEYPYGMYEDEEFAFRMRAYGFKQAVCCQSWVHHEGMATIKELWKKNQKIREEMEIKNRQRCIEDMKFINKKVLLASK